MRRLDRGPSDQRLAPAAVAHWSHIGASAGLRLEPVEARQSPVEDPQETRLERVGLGVRLRPSGHGGTAFIWLAVSEPLDSLLTRELTRGRSGSLGARHSPRPREATLDGASRRLAMSEGAERRLVLSFDSPSARCARSGSLGTLDSVEWPATSEGARERCD